MQKIPLGQFWVTKRIADILHITHPAAEKLKIAFSSQTQTDGDRFVPAGGNHDFTRADIFDAIDAANGELINMVYDAVSETVARHQANRIYIFGGGATQMAEKITGDVFLLPVVNLGVYAAVNAVAAGLWNENMPRIARYLSGRKKRDARLKKLSLFAPKKRVRKIPIMPSTQSFNMESDATYKMFAGAGITKIHCDIIDGFYADNVVGGIGWLKRIRGKTNMKLHVHLMSENPAQWAADAIAAGADEIILSSGVAGLRDAIALVKKAKIPVGIALHPAAKIEILGPVLRDIDEVVVMAVIPGPSGQPFLPDALKKTRALYNTRKKYGLKFKITVDGGINDTNAADCWAAGADWITSGSYLAHAPDFALAVQSLLPVTK
jgi:ribulose-phosphate 3-epimerase